MKTLPKIILAISILFLASLAYSHFFGGKPKILTKRTAELEAILDKAPWVSPKYVSNLSDERPLYQLSFRTCPPCIRNHKEEFPKLQKMGVDTRFFVFARNSKSTKPEERAVLAQIYMDHDWDLMEKWFERASPKSFYAKMKDVSNKDIPSADDSGERTALIENGQVLMWAIGDILKDNGVSMAFPTLLWQSKNGDWNVATGYNAKTNARIRADLAP